MSDSDGNIITGKTKSGFEYSIDKRALNDYRLTKLLYIAEKEDGLMYVEAVNRLFGKEQAERLEEHLAEGKGKWVPNEKLGAEIADIINSQSEIKNS